MRRVISILLLTSMLLLLFMSQEKLELSPETGVIPTFVFYVVLDMAIIPKWLQLVLPALR